MTHGAKRPNRVSPTRLSYGLVRESRPGRRSVLLTLLLISACTFEPRGIPNGSPSEEIDEVSYGAPSAELSEEAALQTMEHFRSSVATGDLSRALAFVDADATIVDALAGEASEAATRGELLLELRRRHSDGITLEPLQTTVTLLPGETAFLLSRLDVLQPDSVGIPMATGQMHETVLLIASSEGWRIRSLHRSFIPGAPLPDSL